MDCILDLKIIKSIDMSELNYGVTTTPYNSGGFMYGFADFLKTVVKQSMEEVIQNKMYENVVLDQNLTAKQLCERWHITKNTLLAWEKKGVISHIMTGGRKKVYSLKDVREAEADGLIKGVA
ncbi:MAG: hypothetical protein NC036_01995 [Muribaculaceae bacterium]|nr:hypothetical protein [Muribaculaceae bacterium]